jgi:flavodoxin
MSQRGEYEMSKSKILVVYYSRTGNTRKVAEYLSKTLEANLEEIIDKKNRSGPIGWLFAGKDAGEKSLTEINAAVNDPSQYDLVIIGSPVWNDTVSTPIRTYLTQNRERLNKTAIFTTQKSIETSAIKDMIDILKEPPLATIQLIQKNDVDTGAYIDKMSIYLEKIHASQTLSDSGED